MTMEERLSVILLGVDVPHGSLAEVVEKVAAEIRAAVAAERERCARVCEMTHTELDAEFASDNGCTDTALVAAERIRECFTPPTGLVRASTDS
jgi:hypothetical protein